MLRFNSNKGFSLIELIMALAMSMALSTMTVYAMAIISGSNKHLVQSRHLDEIKTELFDTFVQPNDALDILRQPANAPVAACIDNETIECPDSWQPIKVFQLRRNEMLEVIGTAEIPFTHDPFSSEQRGFRADGLPCVGFSSSGNDLCPFRYVVEWKANCTGPCRSPKSIAIRANLEYSPTPQKRVAYNTKMRSLKVSHPIPYNRVERISIGGFDYGVCAMFTDGTAKCWGSNSSGLLGTNEPHGTQHARPQFIKGFDGVRALRDIVAINTNANGTRCALLKSKRVVCWGENQTGQVGIGKLGPPEGGVGQSYYTHPVDYVRAPTGGILENVDQIYDGGEHTVCASSGMNVYCWGTYSLEASSCSMRRDLLGATYYQINHEPLFPSGYQSSQTFTSVPNKLMDVAPGDEHSIIDNLESHGMRIEPAGCTIPPDWTRFNKGPAASCFLVGDPARAVCWGRNQNSSLGIGGYLGGGPGSEDLLGPTKEHYIPAVGYQHQRLRPSAKAAISEPAVPPLLEPVSKTPKI